MGRFEQFGTLESTYVYRYLSIDRFLEMIESEQNVLAHISKWEDPNEAYLIRAKIAASASNDNSGEVRNWYKRYRSFYGQSWMLNGEESDILWRAYGKRGETVRIKTSVKSLHDLLETLVTRVKKENSNLYGPGYDVSAFAGTISYVDDMKSALPDSERDITKSLFVKRREFSDEKEYRIVVKVDDMDDIPRRDKNSKEMSLSGGLMKLPIRASDFIKEVLVDPCCSDVRLDEIRCRALNAGFDVDIQKSSLFRWPGPMSSYDGSDSGEQTSTAMPDGLGKQMTPEEGFWSRFRKAYRNGASEFAGRLPPCRRYWGFPIGGGLSYCVVFNRDFARVELYIDSPDKAWNEKTCKDVSCEIKKGCSASDYKFDLLPEGRASRISIENKSLKFTDKSCHDAAVEWLCKMLDSLRAATEPIINKFIVKD